MHSSPLHIIGIEAYKPCVVDIIVMLVRTASIPFLDNFQVDGMVASNCCSWESYLRVNISSARFWLMLAVSTFSFSVIISSSKVKYLLFVAFLLQDNHFCGVLQSINSLSRRRATAYFLIPVPFCAPLAFYSLLVF